MTSLGKVLGPSYYLCVDLNPFAASATRATSQRNKVPIDVVISDLVVSFESRIQNLVDLLICNPPYAVTPSEEVGGDNLQKATSGGLKGREVMDRLFPFVPKLLSKKGIFYLTCIIQNDIRKFSSNIQFFIYCFLLSCVMNSEIIFLQNEIL
ncbi:methyltransferase N6AMT1-like [Stegodyphus dumicola]|uniref:methyltransferase N6AMT1-like n=1 Tax=Stegodyphus dumicola TaxID=202533 RepID=UPI0015ABCB95|nr:methyltransferase N6AMT1-like [Stegodyphus dumicola]